ncbi:MAG: malate synthase G, partial [Pseudomonadota bacterium]|nr:malate synthase G [Pseudomonadota bacterium]
MTQRTTLAGLQIDTQLADFIESEAVAGTDVTADAFWAAAAEVIDTHRDTNKALLAKRDDLQVKIDAWHVAQKGHPHDAPA